MTPSYFRNDRATVALNLLSAMLVRVQSLFSRRHLRKQFPQVAIFSFDHIGTRINAFGRYENDVLHALMQFLDTHGRLHGACLDIGANIGNHTLFFARNFDVVHAFEPARRTHALLQVNVSDLPNVVVHRIALSDVSGELPLIAPLDNIGEGSLRRIEQPGERTVCDTVSVATLDSMKSMLPDDIVLVKIDVEGVETEVLRGAKELLRKCKPAIVFEQQPDDFADGTSSAVCFLRDIGYAHFYICKRTPDTGLRALTILAKLLLGESVHFRKVEHFERAYYPMIIAMP